MHLPPKHYLRDELARFQTLDDRELTWRRFVRGLECSGSCQGVGAGARGMRPCMLALVQRALSARSEIDTYCKVSCIGIEQLWMGRPADALSS